MCDISFQSIVLCLLLKECLLDQKQRRCCFTHISSLTYMCCISSHLISPALWLCSRFFCEQNQNHIWDHRSSPHLFSDRHHVCSTHRRKHRKIQSQCFWSVLWPAHNSTLFFSFVLLKDENQLLICCSLKQLEMVTAFHESRGSVCVCLSSDGLLQKQETMNC